MIRVKIVSSENSSVFSNVLLDTGSHFSLVNDQYASRLGLHRVRLGHGDIQQIVVADSKSVAIETKVRLELQIGGLTLYEWAYCVKSLSHNVILGLKFMRSNGVNLLNDRGVVKIHGVKIPFVSSRDYLSLAVTKANVVIPPRSSKVVFFRANALKKNVPFKIVPIPYPTPGLLFEPLPTLRNGKICAVSRNNTVCAIRLNRNTPIGYAVRSTSSDESQKSTMPVGVADHSATDLRDRDTVVGVDICSNNGGGRPPVAAAMCAPAETARLGPVTRPTEIGQLQVDTSLPSNPPSANSQEGAAQCETFHAVRLEGPLVSTGFSEVLLTNVDVNDPASTGLAAAHAVPPDQESQRPSRSFESLGLSLDNFTLSEQEKGQFKGLVEEFNDVFALNNSELSGCVLGSLKLRPIPGEIKPFRARIYPQSTVDRLETERQIDALFKCGFIERSTSVFSSPCFLVDKANSPGKKRLVFDLREPNKILEQDSYDLPTIPEIMDKIGSTKARFYSSIDLMSAYNQVHLDPDSRQFTAFTSTRGKFNWTRAPFGLVNSGPILCKLLAQALDLEPSLYPYTCVYVDDLILFSASLEDHMELLRKLFSAFRRANFKISAEKSKFFQPSVDFVGHNFSAEGVRPKEEKLSALYNLPIPENKKQLRSALGGISYYRKFMGGYANKVRCLQELLKNDVPFKMEKHHVDAFVQVRDMLKNIPTLAYPDESENGGQFFLTCDASMSAASYVLTQIQRQIDGRE